MAINCGVLLLGCVLAHGAVLAGGGPQVSITREPGAVKVRASDTAAGVLRLETSTNLSAWSVLASTNGTVLELVDTPGQNFSRRFFRAAGESAAEAGTLQFIAPTNNAILTTNRPL